MDRVLFIAMVIPKGRKKNEKYIYPGIMSRNTTDVCEMYRLMISENKILFSIEGTFYDPFKGDYYRS
jgi:hypothetical protein